MRPTSQGPGPPGAVDFRASIKLLMFIFRSTFRALSNGRPREFTSVFKLGSCIGPSLLVRAVGAINGGQANPMAAMIPAVGFTAAAGTGALHSLLYHPTVVNTSFDRMDDQATPGPAAAAAPAADAPSTALYAFASGVDVSGPAFVPDVDKLPSLVILGRCCMQGARQLQLLMPEIARQNSATGSLQQPRRPLAASLLELQQAC